MANASRQAATPEKAADVATVNEATAEATFTERTAELLQAKATKDREKLEKSRRIARQMFTWNGGSYVAIFRLGKKGDKSGFAIRYASGDKVSGYDVKIEAAARLQYPAAVAAWDNAGLLTNGYPTLNDDPRW